MRTKSQLGSDIISQIKTMVEGINRQQGHFELTKDAVHLSGPPDSHTTGVGMGSFHTERTIQDEQYEMRIGNRMKFGNFATTVRSLIKRRSSFPRKNGTAKCLSCDTLPGCCYH